MEIFTRLTLFAALLAVTAPHLSAEWTVKTTDAVPPEAVAESIRAVLSPKAIQLLKDDQVALEIWFRNQIPLKSATASLDSIGETTLLGVVAVRSSNLHDYKANQIPSGVYTARFSFQPQDGDHLGTSEFSTYLVLIDASADQELTGISRYTPMVKASGKITPSGHPVVLSLRPAGKDSGATPSITQPADEHRAVRLTVPVKPDGGEATDLSFDLVFEGKGVIH